MTDNASLCVDPGIYWSRKDTKPTVDQIKIHNAYRLNLGCPK